MQRRSFLKLFGLGAAAIVAEPIIEPVRRFWQVGIALPKPMRPFPVNPRLENGQGAFWAPYDAKVDRSRP